jgi:hypothetical protein
MNRSAALFAWVSGLLAVLMVQGSLCHPVRAAAPPDEDAKNALDGIEILKAKWTKKVESDFNEFKKGEKKPSGKSDEKVIDTAAQWYAYRLTYNDLPNYASVVNGFKNLLQELSTNKNKEFMKIFSQRALIRLRDVLDKEGSGKAAIQRRAQAALMIHRLAEKVSQPELMDELTAILHSGKYPDYVKIHVLKALKEVLERYPAPANGDEKKTRDSRYDKAVAEILKYIDASPKLPERVTPEKKKEIEARFRYFRREAIKALAEVRMPAVAIDKRDKNVKGPVAYWLLKVVANDNLSPPASVGEQVEAAVGLLQIRPPEGSPYQADLGLYYVGRFIEKDLTQAFIEDPANQAGGRVLGERSRRVSLIRREPWRIHAARLAQALEDLGTFTKGKPMQKKTETLVDNATPLLKKLEQKTNQGVEGVPRSNLKGVVEKPEKQGGLMPSSLAVYKGFDKFDLRAEE